MRKMCWIAPPFCFLTALSRFFNCAMCYRFSNCLNGDLPLVFDCLFEVLYICNWKSAFVTTKCCMISQIQKSKGLRSGEYDVHSSAAMKSGVFCRRNCDVAFARSRPNGTLSCTKTTTNVQIIVLPSRSCEATLQSLYAKPLYSWTQTIKDADLIDGIKLTTFSILSYVLSDVNGVEVQRCIQLPISNSA